VRLIGIELRRAFARRLTKLVILVAVAGIIAAGLAVYFHSSRTESHVGPSGPKVQSFKEEAVSQCVNGGPLPFPSPEETLPAVGTGERTAVCQKLVDQLEFGGIVDNRFHVIQLADVLQHVSAFAAIIAWLLGATLIGAEWRTGSMATLLTWESRRTRVMVAKAFAAVLVSFVIVMVLQGLLVGALYPAARFRGSTAGATHAFWRSLGYLGLRSGGLAAGAALIAFAVSSLGRSTAAALGAGFGYLALVEGALLGALVPKSRPWLIVRNAVVFITDQRNVDVPGRSPEQAGLLLLGYAVALFLIATMVMRQRDVN
jgi:ABC-type transport system involved in multi-copper enzyme maturation permease subunit